LVDKNGKSEVFSFYISTKDKWETVIVPLSSRKQSGLDFENIQEIWVYGEVEGIPSSTVRLSLSRTIRLSFWDSTT